MTPAAQHSERPTSRSATRPFFSVAAACLVVSALLYLTIRVVLVTSRDGHTPFLSANDRSRWAAAAALLTEGTFAIDHIMVRPGWNTIDKVSHYGRDGKQHFYSSKPPWISVVLAGQTWVVERVVRTRLLEHPHLVGRIVIWLNNGPLMLLWSWLAVLLAARWGETSFGRLFVIAAATWGTLLTPFGSTINNHLPAAVATLAAFYCLLRVWYDGQTAWYYFFVAGLAAALAAACEMPAVAFLAGVCAALLIRSPRSFVLFALPPILLVAIAYFGINFWAHGTWRPPYTIRVAGDDWTGSNWYNYPGSYWLDGQRRGVDIGEPSVARYAWHCLVGHHGLFSLTPLWLLSAWGVVLLFRRKQYASVLAIAGLTIACLVFYVLLRPPIERNYGGVSCGLRWLLWLVPLWLYALLPAADRLGQSTTGRVVTLLLLGVSIFSAIYPGLNPWTHPWIYQWLDVLGNRR